MTKVTFNGKVTTEPALSHENNGEKFYSFQLSMNRTSGINDVVDCIVPECELNDLHVEDMCQIEGEIRTKNYYDDSVSKKRMSVYCFVKNIDEYIGHDSNIVTIDGFICKPPVYRVTPFGREITDLLLASNRDRGYKSDYLPCIAWSRSAKRISNMPVGTHLIVEGRFQSREYRKALEDGTVFESVAFEISLSKFEEV